MLTTSSAKNGDSPISSPSASKGAYSVASTPPMSTLKKERKERNEAVSNNLSSPSQFDIHSVMTQFLEAQPAQPHFDSRMEVAYNYEFPVADRYRDTTHFLHFILENIDITSTLP